jgi:hypothetical protein
MQVGWICVRLVVAGLGDAGGVDLRVAGVREEGALAVRAPDGGGVRALGVGGEEEDVPVAAGGEDHRVGGVRGDPAGDEVADHDPAGATVHHHELEHLGAGELLHGARRHLAREGLVRAEEELLPRLTARVERSRDEGAAEGPVREDAAVLSREGDALRGALVDDVHRELGQPVDVALPRPEVAAFHGVVEEPHHRVAVVLVVLRGVDTALGGDRVRSSRAVLEAEGEDVVAELAEGGGRGAAGEPGPHHDEPVLPLVGGVHQLQVVLPLLPLLLDRAGGDPGVEDAARGRELGLFDGHLRYLGRMPTTTASGIDAKPRVRITASATARRWTP